MRYLTTAFIATLCLALTGCGYNTIQNQDEAVKAAWSEVVNQYQRRADLDPEPRRDRKRYRGAGAGDTDRSDRGACSRDVDPGDAGGARTTQRHSRNSRRPRAS